MTTNGEPDDGVTVTTVGVEPLPPLGEVLPPRGMVATNGGPDGVTVTTVEEPPARGIVTTSGKPGGPVAVTTVGVGELPPLGRVDEPPVTGIVRTVDEPPPRGIVTISGEPDG